MRSDFALSTVGKPPFEFFHHPRRQTFRFIGFLRLEDSVFRPNRKRLTDGYNAKVSYLRDKTFDLIAIRIPHETSHRLPFSYQEMLLIRYYWMIFEEFSRQLTTSSVLYVCRRRK